MSRRRLNQEGRNRTQQGPVRLRDDSNSSLGQLLRALPQEDPLSQIALARIHSRLLGEPRRPWVARLLGVKLAVAITLLMVGATVGAAAAVVSVRWLARSPTQEAAPEVAITSQPAQLFKRRKVQPAEPAVPALNLQTEEPPALIEPEHADPSSDVQRDSNVGVPTRPPLHVARLSRSTPRAGAGVPPQHATGLPSADVALQSHGQPAAVVISALEQEAAFMAAALRQLREGNRDQAIAQLQTYLGQHPQGAFREEAQVALVTAMVEGGSHDEARSLLNRTAPHLAATPALKLLRAELAFTESCVEALPAFKQLLLEKRAPALQERALYGAAMSEWRCGDRSRAAVLMKRFMHQYPNSTRAINVKEHLEHADQQQTGRTL